MQENSGALSIAFAAGARRMSRLAASARLELRSQCRPSGSLSGVLDEAPA
jgi:hypothetical protein